MKVNIEPHSTINKRFDITTEHLCLMVDYDDVNHMEVDAAVLVLKEIIEKHWDKELYKKLYKEQVIKTWEKNEYGLQSYYDEEGGFHGYLRDHGIDY